ncbi:MAG: hypothetical protein ACRDAX_08095 [Propionibacteriaceae bacterium]
MKNAARGVNRPAIIKAAIAVVVMTGLVGLALAVAGTWPARIGAALAAIGGVAGVMLMVKALAMQSENHAAEIREQSRRALDQLRGQHERERQALHAIGVRTFALHSTIGSLRDQLGSEKSEHGATNAELSASIKQINSLEERIAEVEAMLAATRSELNQAKTDHSARTEELQQAQLRILELSAMVDLYEKELTSGGHAEIFGLPRRIERTA